MAMKVGDKGKQLFKQWEGLVTHVYTDTGGRATIGIGHLLTQSERASGKIIINGNAYKYHNNLTEAQCWELLDQDLDAAEGAVNDAVNVELNQNQFDALVSFVFNVGKGAFLDSTLLKVLNQGKYEEVPSQLGRWNKDNGQVVSGLTARREQEIELWNTAV